MVKYFFCISFFLSALLSAGDFRKLPVPIKAVYGNFDVRKDQGAYLRKFAADYFGPMQKSGFNLIDLKVHNRKKIDEAAFKEGLRQLAKTANDYGLFLTIYTYMPYQRHYDSKYPAVVNSEGKEMRNRYNFLDYGVWKNILSETYRIAQYSRDIPIVAVKVDLEALCDKAFVIPYNDEVWTEFSSKHQLAPDTPRVKRHDVLRQKELIATYEKWIEDKLAGVVAKIREDLHKINPELHLGMMPAEKKLLYRAFIRELGTKKVPAIIDNWSLYNGQGYSSTTEAYVKATKELNPSNIAVTWIRYNTYKAVSLPSHLYYASWCGDGYSGWEIKMLNSKQREVPVYYRLPYGEKPGEYWKAFKTVNNAIDLDLAEKTDTHNRLQLQKISSLVPELKLDDIAMPELIPSGNGNGAPRWFCMRERQVFYFYGLTGEPVKFEIKHLAGRRRPTALIYAVMDMNKNILRRESVSPAEHATFEVSLPQTGIGALVVTGGNEGMAWYGVKIHSKHIAIPAVDGYFFYRSSYTLYSFSEKEPLKISTKGRQAFDLTVDGKLFRIIDKKVMELKPGKHQIKVCRPKKMPKKYYTQDLFLKSSSKNPVYLSDSPQRLLIPEK